MTLIGGTAPSWILFSFRTVQVSREFRVYWKTAYLNTSLTTLETTLGPITRELDPGAYEELRTSVQKVCNYVLVKAGLDRQWGELVRLIALTRNTGHNNGVHDPPNGRNEQVTFQGRTYDFIVGVSVQ